MHRACFAVISDVRWSGSDGLTVQCYTSCYTDKRTPGWAGRRPTTRIGSSATCD